MNPKQHSNGMATAKTTDDSPQLCLLRRGFSCILKEALANESAESSFVKSGAKLEDYEKFRELVLSIGLAEIDAWVKEKGLNEKFIEIAEAISNTGGQADADRINQKRTEVQRLTDKIREEEKKSANMRVELARQEEAASQATRKVRNAKLA